DIRKCVTMDFKKEGNLIYLVGTTKHEFGGSEYAKVLGLSGGIVPKTDHVLLKKSIHAILDLMEKGCIASCHDISEGGLAVALAEMALGGNKGVKVEIQGIGKNTLREDVVLFSESNTRWLIEVEETMGETIEKHLQMNNIPVARIGNVDGENIVISSGNKTLINMDVDEARKTWHEPLWHHMG
ncbi:MAG TPA: phosphoribosylformylglycinamidine synthase II, partial [Thermoplasmatales archaeon]|nr:phosphoribosylformylglycinamidine synthase II [Thermoplasmatales archaeon]